MTNYAMKTLFFLIGLLIPALLLPSFASAVTWNTVHSTYTSVGYTSSYMGSSCVTGSNTDGAIVGPAVGDTSEFHAYGAGGDSHVTQNGYYYYVYCTSTTSHGLKKSADYIPPPTEPVTCQNFTQDLDETGIDCGGSCLSSCKIVCPASDTIVQDVINFSDYCASTFTPLNDGTCPTGAVMGSTIYPNDPDLANVCLSLIRASIVAEAYDDAAYIAAIEAQHSTPFDTTQHTMQTTYTPVVITDNGDGTSTETYSKTETMLDASGNPFQMVTNYSRTTDNATGAEISGSSSESVIADAGENYNPDNYKPENVVDEAPASLDWGEGPDWSTVQNDINISSAENAYTDTAINVTGADPVFNLGTYKGQPLSFSMLPYQSTIQYMGYLIVFMAYVNGFILFAGGKS